MVLKRAQVGKTGLESPQGDSRIRRKQALRFVGRRAQQARSTACAQDDGSHFRVSPVVGGSRPATGHRPQELRIHYRIRCFPNRTCSDLQELQRKRWPRHHTCTSVRRDWAATAGGQTDSRSPTAFRKAPKGVNRLAISVRFEGLPEGVDVARSSWWPPGLQHGAPDRSGRVGDPFCVHLMTGNPIPHRGVDATTHKTDLDPGRLL